MDLLWTLFQIAVIVIGIALISYALVVFFYLVPLLLAVAGAALLVFNYWSGPPEPFLTIKGIILLAVGGFVVALQYWASWSAHIAEQRSLRANPDRRFGRPE